jgi:Icc-related predicted phosphoesterase
VKRRLANPKSKVAWYDLLPRNEARKKVDASLADGRAILEKLSRIGKPVYVVPGNWDWTPNDAPWSYTRKDHWSAISDLPNIIDCYHRRVDAGPYAIIGHGITSGPEYPQYKEDLARYTAAQLRKKRRDYEQEYKTVAKLFDGAKKPVVFLSHNVPYNTPIDRINNPASPRNGWHYGSLLARRAIDTYQPLVSVGGHMHEHFTSCKVGRTTCINAGYGGDVNVLLELTGKRITKLEFKGKTAV